MAEDPNAPKYEPFGALANADETRQAQHQFANDEPTDVNVNAVVARSQVLTIDALGKNYESNADRRNKLADAFMAKLMEKAGT